MKIFKLIRELLNAMEGEENADELDIKIRFIERNSEGSVTRYKIVPFESLKVVPDQDGPIGIRVEAKDLNNAEWIPIR